MISIEDYQRVYKLFDNATPLSCDCGKMCGAVCCKPKKTFLYSGLWVYMLPGEDCLHDKKKQMDEVVPFKFEKAPVPKILGKAILGRSLHRTGKLQTGPSPNPMSNLPFNALSWSRRRISADSV